MHLITVPHASCLPGTDASHRTGQCDVRAAEFADCFAKELRQVSESDCVVLVMKGDVVRDPPCIKVDCVRPTVKGMCDLNRDHCRSEPFRIRVRNQLRQPTIQWVWDIHSFGEGTRMWKKHRLDDCTNGKRTIAAALGCPAPEIVLLDSWASVLASDTTQPLAHSDTACLATYLAERRVLTGVLLGGPADIHREAIQIGVPHSVLIEVNEHLSNARLAQIASLLAFASTTILAPSHRSTQPDRRS